jgi:hypothetical protein
MTSAHRLWKSQEFASFSHYLRRAADLSSFAVADPICTVWHFRTGPRPATGGRIPATGFGWRLRRHSGPTVSRTERRNGPEATRLRFSSDTGVQIACRRVRKFVSAIILCQWFVRPLPDEPDGAISSQPRRKPGFLNYARLDLQSRWKRNEGEFRNAGSGDKQQSSRET